MWLFILCKKIVLPGLLNSVMAFRRSKSIRSERGSEATDSLVSDPFFTAGEAIPVSIPLEKADLGAICFQSSEDDSPEDLQLLYEMNTAELSIQTITSDINGNSKPGTYRIRGIRAANLELINPLVGYLESILVRLVIETDQDVIFEPFLEQRIFSLSGKPVHTRRIVLHASVHECGHLRDILLFMKSDALRNIPVEHDNPYFNPKKNNEKSDENKPPLTYLGSLPWWSIYIPWWIYSGKVRKLLQLSLLLYSVFTIIWASWQLYRHVNVIQLAFDPIVKLLKVYLDDIMVEIDDFLAWFTELSTTFLRPIHIFSGLIIVPMVNTILAFKSVLAPLTTPIISFAGQFSRFLTPVSKCFAGLWHSIMSSRVALQNIDLTQQVAKNLVISSFKAIFQGLLRVVGYSRAKSKEQKVIQASRVPTESKGGSSESLPGTPKRRYTAPNASIPVYYSSSVTKKSSQTN